MQWLVAYTGINQEFIAQRGLEAKQINAYCPIGQKVVKHARKKEIRFFPVFSRYLFVKIDVDPEWLAEVRSTDGVIDILSNNYEPMRVEPEVIEIIKERESTGQFNQLPPPQPKKPRWSKSFEILKALLEVSTEVRI